MAVPLAELALLPQALRLTHRQALALVLAMLRVEPQPQVRAGLEHAGVAVLQPRPLEPQL
jgi:hypothetical protein